MPTPAIRVENLGKRYRLGATHSQTLGARLSSAAGRLFGRHNGHSPAPKLPGNGPSQIDDDGNFWALKDVSFDVQPGEVVGIIGRNGAGKSTLLKILSNIVSPTTGHVELHGRVASLLEVGTGFHPELTGRENVYLNGAILGMSKAEVRHKFDEIVAFADIGEFVDTPVKRYSSGMYVRLAFAVAAHLEPEILIVDEVLAVGDAAFQKKCLGKLKDVAGHGRTVLFVSHNMGPVLQVCTKAVYLERGGISYIGSPRDTVEKYLGETGPQETGQFTAKDPSIEKDITIASAECRGATGEGKARFTHDEPISVNIKYKINRWVTGVVVRMIVRDASLRAVFTTEAQLDHSQHRNAFDVEARVTIPASFLRPGSYWFTFSAIIPDLITLDVAENAFSISVIDGGSKWSKSEGAYDYGCVFAPCEWSVESSPELRLTCLSTPLAPAKADNLTDTADNC